MNENQVLTHHLCCNHKGATLVKCAKCLDHGQKRLILTYGPDTPISSFSLAAIHILLGIVLIFINHHVFLSRNPRFGGLNHHDPHRGTTNDKTHITVSRDHPKSTNIMLPRSNPFNHYVDVAQKPKATKKKNLVTSRKRLHIEIDSYIISFILRILVFWTIPTIRVPFSYTVCWWIPFVGQITLVAYITLCCSPKQLTLLLAKTPWCS